MIRRFSKSSQPTGLIDCKRSIPMDIFECIKSNALILIPALNIIGMILKGIDKFPNKYIPLVLLVFGVTGCILLIGPNVQGAVQGVLVTGCAVYGHQMVKQMKKEE